MKGTPLHPQERKVEKMTGKEFYEIISGAKKITDLGWIDYGNPDNPDRTSLIATVDGKFLEINVAKCADSDEVKFMSYTSIALLLNKVFELTGEKQRVHAGYGEMLGQMFAFFAMKKIKNIYDFGDDWTFEDFKQWEYPDDIGAERWIDTLPDDWKW